MCESKFACSEVFKYRTRKKYILENYRLFFCEMKKLALATIIFTLISTLSSTGDEFQNTVKATLVSNVSSVKPGETFSVGVLFELKPGWHIYWKNPGDSGLPTTLNLNLPEGFEEGKLNWPVPEKFISNTVNLNYGYKDSILLWRDIKAPDDINRILPLEIKGRTSWVSCREICIPGETDVKLNLNSVYSFTSNSSSLFEKWEPKLPLKDDKLESFMTISEDIESDGNSKIHKITIEWKQNVKDFEFFPAPVNSLKLEDINYSHNEIENRSEITFTTSVFKGQKLNEKTLDSLLVWTDNKGKKTGIELPLKI